MLDISIVCVWGGTLWLLRYPILLKEYFDFYGHTGHNLVNLETLKWENNIIPFFSKKGVNSLYLHKSQDS